MTSDTNPAPSASRTRRTFLKGSAATLAGAALAPRGLGTYHPNGSDTIKVALIGCGGRGTGAASQATLPG